jgi:hypothetical protein
VIDIQYGGLYRGSADDTAVFINNSSETSEVSCACCDKFKIELQKTLIQLRSAQKIIELLQEEINLNTPNRTVSTDACYVHHNENSTQLELKKKKELGSCTTSRRKRDSKPEVNSTHPVNRYELLNNLNQLTTTTQNQRLDVKSKTEDRKIRPRREENIKFLSLVIATREDVRQKFLLTLMKTEVTGLVMLQRKKLQP